MKLSKHEVDLLAAVGTRQQQAHIDQIGFERYRQECLAACRSNLMNVRINGAEIKTSLTGYGHAMLVHNGYRGPVTNVHSRKKPSVRISSLIRGNKNADATAGA